MSYYVPGTEETDLKKVIMSLQQAAGTAATAADDIATINDAWTAYTPTVSASSGTATSAAATGRYKQIGKTVHVQAIVTVTTVGTAAGDVNATLPVSAAFTFGGTSLNITNGKSGYSFVNGGTPTFMRARDSTFTTYWANGSIILFGLTYEAA